MDAILNAFKAPFSDAAMAKTTPFKVALAYGLTGFGIAYLLKE